MMEDTDIRETRENFAWFNKISTRWIDMDVYGHVNNVQYYSFFDSAVVEHLIQYGELDPKNSPVIGLVIETKCTFHKSIPFPAIINVGLRVSRIGQTSVTYEIGLFLNEELTPAATGYFVHVYVDRSSQKPVAIPKERRKAMEMLLVNN